LWRGSGSPLREFLYIHDHCSLSNRADDLIDAIMGSMAITMSNNYFTHHNKVVYPPRSVCLFVLAL
jgi:allantoicase